ncbi:MAG: hypothetical protein C0599_07195 [Salinivirgaceae bacterium]|nr:MAG: hypothetical protein C0599_07195 [Salinivirgaceae bacterium]
MNRLFIAILMAFYLFGCNQKASRENHDHGNENDHNTEMHEQNSEYEHDHENEAEHDDHDHSSDEHDHNSEDLSAHNHDEHSHESDDEHDHENETADGVVNYKITEVHTHPFYDILHVSGRIMPSQKGQSMVSARHGGLVVFDNDRLIEGQKVRKGQKLFLISAKGLTHNNLETKFAEVKNTYEKTLQDYQRAQKLLANQIISQSEYQDKLVEYENMKSRFENIKRNYVKGGQPVYASSDGFIANLYVKEGEYVEIGAPLAAIVEDKRLVIKAEVPQDMISQLSYITSASFSPSYSQKVYFTDSLAGQLLSVGRSAGNSVYTPVFFEINYQPELLPGAFADVYLHGKTLKNALTIPKSALLEELNRYYVYKFEHGDFEKQYVNIAGTDGKEVRINSGLKVGDRVATNEVFRIRLTKMSGAMPAHAHNHAH